MELSTRILCRPETAAGFELAAMRVDRVDETTVVEAMRKLAGDPSVGVVLVEERLRQAFPEDLRQRLDRQALPIVVGFPSPSWQGPGAAEEHVLELLRQAVGYRVRPR